MIDSFVFLITHLSLFFTPQCSIQETPFQIYALCKNSSAEYAITIDKENYGDYYYGEWNNNRPAGYGVFTNKVLEESDRYCGYRKHSISKDGLTEFETDILLSLNEKNIGCDLGNCSNGYHVYYTEISSLSIGEYRNGSQQGFVLQTGMYGYPYIGFVSNDLFYGEGIYFSLEDQSITHGIWDSGKLVKVLQSIDLKVYLSKEPTCKTN
ncbi:hypothetical protein EHQ52_15515 [Leptospira koniambonensis]|uniref:Uncharacterized protein n=1 Tax=Leptospira koniambonensis TaxID=2484950 RepID=A0A4R9J408_9LEPT|nr:hypothetical protein [Leptospira koniambonensis]TGL31344.1 hypothetical protein EHQ52_15515 [Leptospira koniambonensis]